MEEARWVTRLPAAPRAAIPGNNPAGRSVLTRQDGRDNTDAASEELCATNTRDDHHGLPVRAQLSTTASNPGRVVVPRLEPAGATLAATVPARAVGDVRPADLRSSLDAPRRSHSCGTGADGKKPERGSQPQPEQDGEQETSKHGDHPGREPSRR